MAFLSSFFKSLYARILFVIIVGAAGITGSVYVGYALIDGAKEETTYAGPELEPPISASHVNFEVGDMFPLENIKLENNQAENFENVLKRQKSIVIFIDEDCDACTSLLTMWNNEVRSKLLTDVQTIACIPEQASIPDDYRQLLAGMTIIRYDSALWAKRYHLVSNPMIISTDIYGFVQHVQYGFDGFFEYQIINKYCVTK